MILSFLQVEREREKAARLSKEGSEAELDLIHDDEIEAMRREALEEEREERSLEVNSSELHLQNADISNSTSLGT